MPDLVISLDLINRHFQEPNRNRYESRYFWEELYGLVAAAGFDAIEMPYEPVWQFGGRSGVPFTRYSVETKYESAAGFREFLARCGIRRIDGVYFDPSMFLRNDNLDFYFGATGHFAGEALQHAADLGARYFNISATPAYGRIRHYHSNIESIEDDFTARTEALLTTLAQQAAASNITLAIRHEYWSLFRGERVFALLDELPSTAKIDVDTASLAISGFDPATFIREHAQRIGSVHLTDTHFVDDDNTWKTPNPEFPANRPTQVYRDLGQGTVDLRKVWQTLTELKFDGPVVCSCRQTRDHQRALLRTRAYLDGNVLAAN